MPKKKVPVENPHLTSLRKRVAKAPTVPGIYRWKDDEGMVLYVGKAKNLRNRLRQYVAKGAGETQGPWKRSMFRQLADFDVTIVSSEVEALVLETNLIKELRPKYNVLMKDDKNFVYVEITVQDPYPRVEVVRQMRDPKAKYFGPYLSAYDTHRALDMLHRLFRLRACRPSLDALNRAGGDRDAVYNTGKLRPCLDSQIGQCNGLCAGTVSWDEYRGAIEQVVAFFKGDFSSVLARAEMLMRQAAAERKFEQAKELRDMMASIESMRAKQVVSDTSGEEVDVVGIALLAGRVQVVVFKKREGKLVAEESYALAGYAENAADALEQFLPQYFVGVPDIPKLILVSEEFPGRAALEEVLSARKGRRVTVRVPERGKKTQLLALAERNAEEKAKQAEARWEAEERNVEAALEGLRSALDLPAKPRRIEGYDISHTGGTETVGSMTVFLNGKPKNERYRSFTIRTMGRGVVDDYKALKEVLTRRLRHLSGGLKFEEKKWKEGGITFGRARKQEQNMIEEIIARNADILSQSDISYRTFLVARFENVIIGFVRLREHPGRLREVSDVWVDESYRGQHLASFIVRKLLHSVKRGKVYVHAIPEGIEQYYVSMGFRHVIKPPAFFLERYQRHRVKHPDAEERPVLLFDTTQNKPDASLAEAPDLLVIDGGKGQLGVAVEVLRRFELSIPVIGLAKREEEVFQAGREEPVTFPEDSAAKFLLMRLRDEAHRFANRHRAKRAAKTAVASQLDAVPGIGPETRQKLLQEFGSIDGIRRAPGDELRKVLTEEQIRELRRVL